MRVAIVAQLEGVLEPCGCSPQSTGGLDRMAAILRRLRSDGEPLLVIALGDTFYARQKGEQSGADRAQLAAQDALKANALLAVLEELQVQAILLGPTDLERAGRQLRALSERRSMHLVSADAASVEGIETRVSAVLEIAGHKLGFASSAEGVADARERSAELVLSAAPEVNISPGLAGGTSVAVWRRTRPEKEPSAADWLPVQLGRHGEDLTVLELAVDGSPAADMTSSPSPALRLAHVRRYRVGDEQSKDPAVHRLLEQVFARIGQNNQNAEEAVELAADAIQYVGSRTCAACHTGAYQWWLRSQHGRAYDTLLARGRSLDLDCIACHVTGYGKPGGASLANLQELRGVGCESCHGPGSRHVSNPQQPDAGVSRRVGAERCISCHDAEHSAAFDYDSKVQRLRSPMHAIVTAD